VHDFLGELADVHPLWPEAAPFPAEPVDALAA
jgi:tRNA-dihydrouridine synthase B